MRKNQYKYQAVVSCKVHYHLMVDFDHHCYIIFLIIFFFPGVVNSSLSLGTNLRLAIKAATNKLLGNCCSIVATYEILCPPLILMRKILRIACASNSTLLQRHFEECKPAAVLFN